MSSGQFDLLKQKNFAPLFVTQFLGAFNDNFFKNAVGFGMVYGALALTDVDPKIVITLAAGLFILPFFLLSALGGQLADKYPKNRVIRVIKFVEIIIAAIGAAGLLTQSLFLLLLALFLLGAQSALFGPSKLAILPEHLGNDKLISANGLMSAGSFLAILTGNILGGLLVTIPDLGVPLICGLLLICGVGGYIAAWNIPLSPALQPDLKLNWNIPAEIVDNLGYAFKQPKNILLSILGISWFYFIGGTFLAQFPNYAKENLNADEMVLTLFLVLFSVGVAVGAIANNKLLKGRIEATYVPVAALGMAFFALDLSLLDLDMFMASQSMHEIGFFLSHFTGWRICFDLFFMAFFSGLYVVPLNAIIQELTAPDHRARVIAASSMMDALFIVTSSVLAGSMLYMGAGVDDIFLAVAILSACVAIYICRLLPVQLLKSFLQGVLKLLYNVEVRGLENYDKAGPRAVIVGNHVSLLDAPLLAAFLPGKPMFALDTQVAKWWWVKPWLGLIDAFPIDPTNPFSMKSLIREVQKDKHCVIFPEGRLTMTGALMKVYEGPGMIADKADAMIIPVRLDGVQHTPFARLRGKVPLRTFPKIIITILEPREFKVPAEATGRKRRQIAGRQLFDLMEEMMFLTQAREQTMFEALLKTHQVCGDKTVIAEDIEFKPLTMKKLLMGSVVLGRKFAAMTERGENVGVLLPNSVGTVVTYFGLQTYGRVPAMLNFSAGAKSVTSACQTACIKTVLTSRRFIELGRLEALAEAISQHARLVYLEDLKQQIGIKDKLYGLVADPAEVHKKHNVSPDEPATILFTSGSEGSPKGVVLSHKNFMSNVVQLGVRVDFNTSDTLFNCLPMFHSFGLTGGTILPILSGVKTFLYPSPLHFRIVPEIVYTVNATIMFGTDTFLNGYARMAHPYDFYRMRYIFAGAEKVKDETRRIYMERFGVRILEGYGATETAPVLAVNSAMHFKPGTVGRMLTGIERRLEDVPGITDGKRLYVRGPNVMLGYLLADNPGVLKPPVEGWHDTGDIVDIDAEGYIKILGRAKRFAKIAGEMISLTAVEAMAKAVYPAAEHAAVTLPDPKKGEQIILVTTHAQPDRADLLAYASQNGISELGVPRKLITIDKMLVLGTGKTDYVSLQDWVKSAVGE